MNRLSWPSSTPIRARPGASAHHRLTRLYIVALMAIALLSVTAQVWIHRALTRQSNDARVINIAGRQRMLSQRLAKNAVIVALGANPSDQNAARAEMTLDLEQWTKAHRALQNGDTKMGLPGANSPAIAARFAQINPGFETIASSAQRILAGQKGDAAIAPMLAAEKPWVKGMDGIVFALDAEATARVTELQRGEIGFLALTLAVLCAEALWIFRPTARHIETSLRSLDRAQSRQQAMLEAVPDAVLLFDAEGRLLEAYPPGAREIVGPGEINFARHLKAARAIGGSKTWEFCDETGRTLEARLVPIDSSAMQGGLALVRDVSQLKEMDRLKDEFIATVSHELRTPLTAIRGSLGLLGGGVTGELSPTAANLVTVSLSNVDRLTRLVNDILDLERIGSGQLRLSLEKIGFDEAAQSAVEANRLFAREFEVCIEFTAGAPGAIVRSDSDRLAQIFTNLLSNAAKFSPRGGMVRVATIRRRDEFGAWLRVEISDDGPGIPVEFQKRIFGKFTQADGSDTRTAQGSGLGLSIARALTEKLGGRIGFETAPGQGTTFWCEWPEPPRDKIDAGIGREKRVKELV